MGLLDQDVLLAGGCADGEWDMPGGRHLLIMMIVYWLCSLGMEWSYRFVPHVPSCDDAVDVEDELEDEDRSIVPAQSQLFVSIKPSVTEGQSLIMAELLLASS